ncbi:hypothetical protein [Collimonas sp. OK307]|uniref:hypothetical protein n=1 Tax=Collimonas sp. OK307 TaxID=1801620 RepID=UPI001587E1A6|nr:hypothetical protein [Collimonas sp. OK307]
MRPGQETKNAKNKTRAPYGSGLTGMQQDTTKLVPVIEATGQPADGKTPFEKPLPD